jgi:hypothetical protein
MSILTCRESVRDRYINVNIHIKLYSLHLKQCCRGDPDPSDTDPDPAFDVDTDQDPAFRCDPDLDLIV